MRPAAAGAAGPAVKERTIHLAEIARTFVSFGTVGAALTFTALSGQDDFVLDNADGRVTLLIRNGNTQNAAVVLHAGDGHLASLGDVTVAVAGSQTAAVPLSRVDSARVKHMADSGRGTVQLSATVESGGTVGNVAVAVLSVE